MFSQKQRLLRTNSLPEWRFSARLLGPDRHLASMEKMLERQLEDRINLANNYAHEFILPNKEVLGVAVVGSVAFGVPPSQKSDVDLLVITSNARRVKEVVPEIRLLRSISIFVRTTDEFFHQHSTKTLVDLVGAKTYIALSSMKPIKRLVKFILTEPVWRRISQHTVFPERVLSYIPIFDPYNIIHSMSRLVASFADADIASLYAPMGLKKIVFSFLRRQIPMEELHQIITLILKSDIKWNYYLKRFRAFFSGTPFEDDITLLHKAIKRGRVQ
ncbi:MAG: hypothetical protein QXP42_02220 [Candidatus Micrarchaeia archaeon]